MMETMMNRTDRAMVNWNRVFSRPPAGADGGLGAAKEAAAAFLNLAEDDEHQDDGYEDLGDVQVNQWLPLF